MISGTVSKFQKFFYIPRVGASSKVLEMFFFFWQSSNILYVGNMLAISHNVLIAIAPPYCPKQPTINLKEMYRFGMILATRVCIYKSQVKQKKTSYTEPNVS